MTLITIPKILTERLTEQGAQALINMLNTITDSSKTQSIEIVEERFERRLAQESEKIIRWMFIFWVGQLGSMTAILFVFFK